MFTVHLRAELEAKLPEWHTHIKLHKECDHTDGNLHISHPLKENLIDLNSKGKTSHYLSAPYCMC